MTQLNFPKVKDIFNKIALKKFFGREKTCPRANRFETSVIIRHFIIKFDEVSFLFQQSLLIFYILIQIKKICVIMKLKYNDSIKGVYVKIFGWLYKNKSKFCYTKH